MLPSSRHGEDKMPIASANDLVSTCTVHTRPNKLVVYLILIATWACSARALLTCNTVT